MTLFGDDPEEFLGDNGEPSQYELLLEKERQDKLLKQQIRQHGEEAMQTKPVLPLGSGIETEPFERSYVMKMPGEKVTKRSDKDPLRSLMKQMGLTQGPDIEAGDKITGTKNSGKGVSAEKLPHYDKRGPTPLKNPQKRHVRHPGSDAHGLCLSTGFAAAWIGGVSSGKTTCLLSALGHNHGHYRYKNVFLMHPDAESAKAGEYGLCDDIKVLDHFPTIEWWEKNSPGRTALIIDDASWQLSKKGTPNQASLADRTMGYLRSHKTGSMDIYIGQQQVYGIPPNIRKLISTWFLFPARISPQTHTALAQATMLDRNTLRKCLDFVEGDYGFLLVNNLNDGRSRCRVNGWRAIRGLL
eukprot:COSAG02_NODE_665_length_18739_cov_9.192918_11_plen_355_part_00